jgi:outer membrane protein assembly factor BamE (lipoprotein component of BamABCDE complex)
MQAKTSKFKLVPMWLVTGLVASALAACTAQIDRRGYIPKAGAFNQVHAGMAKTEVEGVLGSPTTTASINFAGDSYYYISYTTETTAFLKPVERDRQIIAVRFDKGDRVSSIAQYGLQDGRIIDMNTQKTAVVGSEFSVLKELFKGAGGGASDANMLPSARGPQTH